MHIPQIKSILNNYSWGLFAKDISGGVIVGIVALPLAIAFGVASGVSPVNGLFTTIIAGVIIALFSGIPVQIGGPTGACIVIIYSINAKFGAQGLVISTFLAGIMLILMGLLRLGRLIKLIPDPLVEGFTAGIAVDLFISQIKDLFGLKIIKLPGDFTSKIMEIASHFHSFSYLAIVLGGATILINQVAPYIITKKIPGPILSITIVSFLAYFFRMPVETIGTKYGIIVTALPTIEIHKINLSSMILLIRPAFAIAILVAIMSLVSGVVAEGLTGQRLRSNKELVAEGIANIASSIFGGIPVTGSIARTITNIENGGKTRIAGIVQSVTILIIILLISNWISYIPLSAVAGLLMVVAYNMSKWRRFIAILKGMSGDTALMLITFFVTIFIDLTVGIEIGFVFATIQFMRRMSSVSNVRELTNKFLADNGIYIEEQMVNHDIPKGVSVYEINGPLFFGAAYKFNEIFTDIKVKPFIFIIRMRNVPIMDSTGVRTLLKVSKSLRAQNIHLVISEFKYDLVDEKLSKLLITRIGKDNIHGTLKEAIIRSEEIMEEHRQFC